VPNRLRKVRKAPAARPFKRLGSALRIGNRTRGASSEMAPEGPEGLNLVFEVALDVLT
jgi:hypothetical protein